MEFDSLDLKGKAGMQQHSTDVWENTAAVRLSFSATIAKLCKERQSFESLIIYTF